MHTVHVIIPAGGTGKRFGGHSKKQFLFLAGETLLNRSIRLFLYRPDVVKVVVCLPSDELKKQRAGDPVFLSHEKLCYVSGGKTRAESVYKGFCQLKAVAGEDIVLIHDAARPLVPDDVIKTVVTATGKSGAAVPGVPLSDTIKKIDVAERVCATLSRDDLRAVQTPQGFLYSLLKKAYEEIDHAGSTYTDEAMLLEAIGAMVHVVPGSKDNIKVTTPFDLLLAELILKNRE